MSRINLMVRILILTLASVALVVFGIRPLISPDVKPQPKRFPVELVKMESPSGLSFLERLDGFLTGGVTLSILLLVALFLIAERKKKPLPNMKTGFLSFISGTGLSTGLKVALLGIAPFKALEGYDQVSILLGGVAMIWIAVETGVEQVKDALV